MAFKKTINDSIRKTILVLLTVPLVVSSNTDCKRKSFHCVNSTHFMICVDLGGGVSSTIDDFVIPCPSSTECRNTNDFECEFPPLTTLTPTIDMSVTSVFNPSEITTLDPNIISTTAPELTTDPLTEANAVSITTIPTQNSPTIGNGTVTPFLDSTTTAVEIILGNAPNLAILNKNISNTMMKEIITSDPTQVSVAATEIPSTMEVITEISNNMTDTTFDTTSSTQTVTTENVVDISFTQQNKILTQGLPTDFTTVMSIDNQRSILVSTQAPPTEIVTESYITTKDIIGQLPTEMSTATIIDNFTNRPDLTGGSSTDILKANIINNNTTQDFTQAPPSDMSSATIIDNYTTLPGFTEASPTITQDFTQASSLVTINNNNTVSQDYTKGSPIDMFTETIIKSNNIREDYTQAPPTEMTATTMETYTTRQDITENPPIDVNDFITTTKILLDPLINEVTIQNESIITNESVISDTTLKDTATKIYPTTEVTTKNNITDPYLDSTSSAKNVIPADISNTQPTEFLTQQPLIDMTINIDNNISRVDFTQLSPVDATTESYITTQDVIESLPTEMSLAATIIDHIDTQNITQAPPTEFFTETPTIVNDFIMTPVIVSENATAMSLATTIIDYINTQDFTQAPPTEISQITSIGNNAHKEVFTETPTIVNNIVMTTDIVSENALTKVTTPNENISNTIANEIMILDSKHINVTDISSKVQVSTNTDVLLDNFRHEQATTENVNTFIKQKNEILTQTDLATAMPIYNQTSSLDIIQTPKNTVTENYIGTVDITKSLPTETSKRTIVENYTTRPDFTEGSPTEMATEMIIDNKNTTQVHPTEIFTTSITDHTRREDIAKTSTAVKDYTTTTEIILKNAFNDQMLKNKNINMLNTSESIRSDSTDVTATEISFTKLDTTPTNFTNKKLDTNSETQNVLDILVTKKNEILAQTDVTNAVTASPTEISTAIIIDNITIGKDIEILSTAMPTRMNIDEYAARQKVTKVTTPTMSATPDFSVTPRAHISAASVVDNYTTKQGFTEASPTVMSTATIIANYDTRKNFTEVLPTETSSVTLSDSYDNTKQDFTETPIGISTAEASPTGYTEQFIDTTTTETNYTVTPTETITDNYITKKKLPQAPAGISTATILNNITIQDLAAPPRMSKATIVNNDNTGQDATATPIEKSTVIVTTRQDLLDIPRAGMSTATIAKNKITRQDFTATHTENSTSTIINKHIKQGLPKATPELSTTTIVNNDTTGQHLTARHTENAATTITDVNTTQQNDYETASASIIDNHNIRQAFTETLPTETSTVMIINSYNIKQNVVEEIPREKSTSTMIDNDNTDQSLTGASLTETSIVKIGHTTTQDVTESKLTGLSRETINTTPLANKHSNVNILKAISKPISNITRETKIATLDTELPKGTVSVERASRLPSSAKASDIVNTFIDIKSQSQAVENLAMSNILDSTKAPGSGIEKISLTSQPVTVLNSIIKTFTTTPLITIPTTNSENYHLDIINTGKKYAAITSDQKTTLESRSDDEIDTENKNVGNGLLTSSDKLNTNTIAATQREQITPSTLTLASETNKIQLDVAPKSNNAHTDSSKRFSKTSIGGDPLLSFCEKRNRGRYSDSDDCSKFYICIGRKEPIVGKCPVNTVFSDFRKQCTKNKSHCVRENEFRCTSDGRFSDIEKYNIYYICVKRLNTFIRFQFQCQAGYYLNKTTVRCSRKEVLYHQSISIDKNSEISSSDSKNSNDETNHSNITEKRVRKEDKGKETKEDFQCSKEGKFADPNSCKKYYVCSKRKNSEFRRRRKSCDSDERFHKDKKKCVDAESYEC